MNLAILGILERGLVAQLGKENFFGSFRPSNSITLSLPILIVLITFIIGVLCLIVYNITQSRKDRNAPKIELGKIGQYYLKKPGGENETNISLIEIIELYVKKDDLKKALVELIFTLQCSPKDVLYRSVFFERAVDDYMRTRNPRKEVLAAMPAIRNELSFFITDPKNEFVHSRQIPKGYKMRASFPNHKTRLSFITMIVAANEKEFAILPPKINGMPADISNFQTISFNLYDTIEKEFMFQTQILRQTKNEKKNPILQHSSNIQELIKRKFKRYYIKFNINVLPIQKKQNYQKLIYYDAEVFDISSRGIQIIFQDDELVLKSGTFFRFDLDPAEIKELEAQPIKVIKKFGKLHVHMRFRNISEVNKFLLDRYIAILEEENSTSDEILPEN